MSKHLRLYEKEENYEADRTSCVLWLPNVAYCKDTDKVHYKQDAGTMVEKTGLPDLDDGSHAKGYFYYYADSDDEILIGADGYLLYGAKTQGFEDDDEE